MEEEGRGDFLKRDGSPREEKEEAQKLLLASCIPDFSPLFSPTPLNGSCWGDDSAMRCEEHLNIPTRRRADNVQSKLQPTFFQTTGRAYIQVQ